MKVLIFIDSLESGGAQKQALLLAKHLSDRYSVKVIVYYGEKTHQFLGGLINGLNVEIIRYKGNHFNKLFRIWRLFRANKESILFTYILLPNFVGGFLGRIAGIRLIVGGIRNSYLLPWKERLERFLQNNISHHTIYNCYSGYKLLGQRGFNQRRASVIPNCYEAHAETESRSEKDRPVILSVGRFTAQKDYLTSLKIIKELKVRQVDFIYRIIGWGPMEVKVHQWISELDLNASVELYKDPKDPYEFYRAADIFLLSSRFEGLPNVLMEAMDHSLPIVSTDVGDCNRLVEHGKTGFLFNAGEFQIGYQHLNLLCKNYELRLQMGMQGRRKLLFDYNEEVFKKSYTDFIKKMLSND